MMYGEGDLINLHWIKKLFVLSLTLLLTFILSEKAFSQEYKYEIGGTAGSSFYMGDANKTNLFLNSGLSGGALFRYNITFNWAIKANLVAGKVSANSADSDNEYPFEQHYTFNRNFADLGAQVEFNFLPYSDKYAYIGTKPYSPYVFLGAGLTYGSGNEEYIGLNIPFGMGFKYKVKNRLNLGIEFSVRKLFADSFDVTDITSEWGLDEPYGIKSSLIKNRDWYALTMVSMTWEFGSREDPCHGM